MRISVGICTWNRAALLDQTLLRFREVRVPEDCSWEICVVDNNCTDNTGAVIARHAEHLPVRHLREEKQGHSNARNCAVAAAEGDYLLWTDDDVLVDPNWLVEYAAAFRRWPECSIFGGPVRPWFEGTCPDWLQRVWPRVSNAYAVRSFGDAPEALSPQVLPFGANFALRTEVQRRYRYDPELGRNKTGMMGGDEITVLLRMFADGLEGMWVPSATLAHYIPSTRQTTRYLRSYFRGQGEFEARQFPEDRTPRLFGKPRWKWRRAIEAELRYRFQRVSSRPEVWIDSLIRASTLWGQLWGFRSDTTAPERELMRALARPATADRQLTIGEPGN